MSEPSESPVDLTRPRAGCWIFVLPVLVGAAVVLGYGFVFFQGARGRPAQGPVVTMTFSGCPQAVDAIEARVLEMGLGDPTIRRGEPFEVVAQLPEDPDVAASIPGTLARVGRLEIRDRHAVIVQDHVAGAVMRMDLSADPSTAVTLDAEGDALLEAHMTANPAGSITLWIDDEAVGERPNSPPEIDGRLELRVAPGVRATRIRTAAERGVVLNNGPLPCAPTVRVTP